MATLDIIFKTEHQLNFDLNFYHFGEEVCSPSHQYGPAVRDHYLIHYVISGEGTFTKGSQKWLLSQDMCFLIHPNEVTTYQADANHPWHYVWIGFNGAKAAEFVRQCGFTVDNPCLAYALNSEFNFSQHIIDMMGNRAFEDSSAMWQMGQLYVLLSWLIKNNELVNHGHNVRTSKEIYVHKAIQYMLNNYSNEISIRDVAEYMGLDRSYFFSLFKNIMDKSPKAFLTEIRVKKAKELMLTTSLNFYEIAFSVGYNDPLLFSKIIKKHTGLSPSQYRNQLK